LSEPHAVKGASSSIGGAESDLRAPHAESGSEEVSEGASAEPGSSETARAAGRGGVAVLGAKAFFILAGLLQQALLPRAIGLAGYGALSRVLAAANIVNNVAIASATQGVSRAVAKAGDHDEEAFRGALRVHVVVAFIAGASFFAFAPAIAAFERAPYITLPLRVASGVVFCYGVYAAFIGCLNGTARFSQQAALDVTFAVLRTTALLGGGWLFLRAEGSGVLGATAGFVVAAICIVPLAMSATGLGRKMDRPDPQIFEASTYLLGLLPLAIAQLFTNGVMQVDITLRGRCLSVASASTLAGLGVDSAKIADEWVGVYNACKLFAFLPYQLLFSVTQVLFPFVARAHAAGDASAVRAYVARGARIGALATGLMVAVIAAMPGSLLAFAYPVAIADRGETTLRVLAIGQGEFAMLGLASTVLVSLGRHWRAAGLTLGVLVVLVGSAFAFVPGAAFGAPQLLALAWTTTLTMGLGLVVAAVIVVYAAGAFIPFGTAGRVGAALAIAVLVGSRLPRMGKLVAPIEAIGVALVYVVVLVLTREIGAEDAELVRSLVGRRKG
jgi:stage V sporulation protein B